MAGTDELQAEGGAGGSLTAGEPTRGSLPRDWFTEEMVGVFWVASGDTRFFGDRVAQIRAGLAAIAPMVEKLLEMQADGAYGVGYAKGYSDGYWGEHDAGVEG